MSVHVADPSTSPTATGFDPARLERTSARFGVAFSVGQLLTMVAFTLLVLLPHGGAVSDPAAIRGARIHDAESAYRVANSVFGWVGLLLLGFLGVVAARLRAVDRSGLLATVAVASGTLMALVWPLAGALHSVTLEVAASGTDLRILAGWDAVAPYFLAFSAVVRVFFVGAIVLALRASGAPRLLVGIGVVASVLGLVGSATPIVGELFPVLALSTLLYEVWVGAVAWRWSRRPATGA